MNDNRLGGTLLVIGNAAGIITMVLHPVAGHGMLPPPEMARLVVLDRAVHGLGIAAIAVTFLGALALTRRLAAGSRFALAGLVIYGFAAVSIVSAAIMSGFVAADILSRMVEGDPKLESRRMLLDYTFRLNQGYSTVFTIGACVAIGLWSLAILKNRRMSPALAIYGLVVGTAICAALFAGRLPLDVHGFGLVVLAQAIWFVLAGVTLARTPEESSDASTGNPATAGAD